MSSEAAKHPAPEANDHPDATATKKSKTDDVTHSGTEIGSGDNMSRTITLVTGNIRKLEEVIQILGITFPYKIVSIVIFTL